MVLLAVAQTAIAKSRLLKARKIQQLQLESGFLRLKLRLFGAVAHHLVVGASWIPFYQVTGRTTSGKLQ